jgi:hypothetical protein
VNRPEATPENQNSETTKSGKGIDFTPNGKTPTQRGVAFNIEFLRLKKGAALKLSAHRFGGL